MSEGELHKKILSLYPKKNENDSYQIGDKSIEIIIDKTIKVLDEAKQDFPNRIVVNHDKPLTLERAVDKLQENWRWFEKWFGNAEK